MNNIINLKQNPSVYYQKYFSDNIYKNKYIKYKNKYLKLKELLGGRDPLEYNGLPTKSESFNELKQIIINFFIDLVEYNVLLKTHAINATTEQQKIILKYFSDILKLPLENFIIEKFYNDIYWSANFTGTMKIIKFDDPVTGKLESKDNYNIHVSLRPSNYKDIKQDVKYIPDIRYHLTASHGTEGQWISDRSITKNDVYDFFNNQHLGKFYDSKDNHFIGKYLILAIYAFNFGVQDKSRDFLQEVLKRNDADEMKYINMLSTKYISKILRTLGNNNLDYSFISVETYSKTTKDFIIFEQQTLSDVLKVIEEYNYNRCKEQQENENLKAEQEKKRQERDLLQKQAEQLVKNQQKQLEQTKVDLNELTKASIKTDYADFIISDNNEFDSILKTTERISDFNNLLHVIKNLEGVIEKAEIKRIVGKTKIPSSIKLFIPRLLNQKGMINYDKIPKK